MIYISHSIMEGQRRNNHLNPRCFCFNYGICTKVLLKTDRQTNGPDRLRSLHRAEGVVRGEAYRPRQRVLLAARLECRLAAGSRPRNGDERRSVADPGGRMGGCIPPPAYNGFFCGITCDGVPTGLQYPKTCCESMHYLSARVPHCKLHSA